MNLSN